MVEGARLELVYGATHRGFESLPLCHKILYSTSTHIIPSFAIIVIIKAKGILMKHGSTLLLYTLIILLLNSCGDEVKESHTQTMTNPVDTYLDSRVDAMELAK